MLLQEDVVEHPAAAGQAGSAVVPAAVTLAEDADIADPGKMAEIKAEQIKSLSE